MAADATVGSIFESYRQRFATLNLRRSSILLARNGEFTTPDTMLREGDEVAFLPPVSGGSGSPEIVMAKIVRETIDVRRLVNEVQGDGDGAVVTFEGVVRNNTKGRQTRHLEYEAYEPLAQKQMERVATEIAAKHAVSRVGLVHRLGRLEIGEASVAIAVSAPHRRAAFEAAHEAIDRLKREVPVWKKEFFADGEVWVEGEWDEALAARQQQVSETQER